MKYPKGFYRQVDGTGRITLPMELRKALNIEVGDSVACIADGEGVHLEKVPNGRLSEKDALKTVRGLWTASCTMAVVCDLEHILVSGPGTGSFIVGKRVNPEFLTLVNDNGSVQTPLPITMDIHTDLFVTAYGMVRDDFGACGIVALLNDKLGDAGTAFAVMMADILSSET